MMLRLVLYQVQTIQEGTREYTRDSEKGHHQGWKRLAGNSSGEMGVLGGSIQKDIVMPGNSKWKKIQKEVFVRDCFRCRKCGNEKRLAVHHLDGSGDWWKQKTANNDLNNLITLCASCHSKTHWQQAKKIGKDNLYEYSKK